jgi:hypothetical protein
LDNLFLLEAGGGGAFFPVLAVGAEGATFFA